MKVLFDGHYWSDGPPSGRMVVRELVTTWINCYPTDTVAVAVNKQCSENDSSTAVEFLPRRIKIHPISNILEMRTLARKISADFTISQNFSSLGAKDAVFIHDGIFADHPEWFTPAERLYFRMIPMLAKYSEFRLTSSRTEAIRLERVFPRLAPVRPVGLAPSPNLLNASPQRPAHVRTNRFLLAVGRLNARKNIEALIEALFVEELICGSRPILVVGEPNGRTASRSETVQKATLEGAAIFLGSVTDSELSWLYRTCQLFLYPSLDEGYGLPPVEALLFGAQVVVSDLQVFREVTKPNINKVKFCNPNSKSSIAAAVRASLNDNGKSCNPSRHETWETVVSRIRNELITSVAK